MGLRMATKKMCVQKRLDYYLLNILEEIFNIIGGTYMIIQEGRDHSL